MATATIAESFSFHHLSIYDVVFTPTLYFYDSKKMWLDKHILFPKLIHIKARIGILNYLSRKFVETSEIVQRLFFIKNVLNVMYILTRLGI